MRREVKTARIGPKIRKGGSEGEEGSPPVLFLHALAAFLREPSSSHARMASHALFWGGKKVGRQEGGKEGRREGWTGGGTVLLPPVAFGLETDTEVNEALLDLLRDARKARTANFDKDLFKVVEFQEIRDGILVLRGGKEGGKKRGAKGGWVLWW